MSVPTHSITTLLSELTPEQMQTLHQISGWSSDLPDNVFPAVELHQSRTSIHRASTNENDWIPLHTHNFYEFIYCRQVPDMEYLVGGHRYRIHTGDVIYIPPGIPHCPTFSKCVSEPFIRDEVWMSTDFTSNFGRRLPDDILSLRKTPYLFRMDSHWQSEISILLQKGVVENEQRDFRWDNAIDGYATLLLVAMCRALLDVKTQVLQQEEPNLFDQICAYLEANLSQKITLEETANHFYISKSTVNRVFQKHMGTSFYRCLTKRRMLAAQQMIRDGTALEEVSVKVGFSDYATFYRAFRQAFGISPRQFQKLQIVPDPSYTPPYL